MALIYNGNDPREVVYVDENGASYPVYYIMYQPAGSSNKPYVWWRYPPQITGSHSREDGDMHDYTVTSEGDYKCCTAIKVKSTSRGAISLYRDYTVDIAIRVLDDRSIGKGMGTTIEFESGYWSHDYVAMYVDQSYHMQKFKPWIYISQVTFKTPQKHTVPINFYDITGQTLIWGGDVEFTFTGGYDFNKCDPGALTFVLKFKKPSALSNGVEYVAFINEDSDTTYEYTESAVLSLGAYTYVTPG